MVTNAKTQQNLDDLNADSNLKRIDDLEEFKLEFEGEKFYEKICMAIKKSKEVEKDIQGVVWDTIKTKLIWIIISGVALVLIDLILRALPSILKNIG